MRLTIIPDDKAVYKDQIVFDGLNLTTIPKNLHALQWYDTHGEVEWKDKPNEKINELPEWVDEAVRAWEEAYALHKAPPVSIGYTQEQKMVLLRLERDKRLAASDWTQLEDVIATKTEEWKVSWDTYRQALRDVPNQPNLNIDDPNWPIPPQ